MKNKIIAIMLGIVLINLIGAVIIPAGTNDTFRINTIDTIYYDVVGNSSDMEGMSITQDIYEDYSNITISIDFMYLADEFTIIFFNKEKEIIEVPGKCSSCGGGSRTVYKDRNITVEKIVYVNQTEDEEEPIPLEGEKKVIWPYFFWGVFIIAIILMWYKAFKKIKKNKNDNSRNPNI